MPFDFEQLPPRAKRAAFANMDRTKAAKVPDAPKVKRVRKQAPKAREVRPPEIRVDPSRQVSRQYMRTGVPTAQDVETLIRNYRAMHGEDPTPAQVAKMRRKARG